MSAVPFVARLRDSLDKLGVYASLRQGKQGEARGTGLDRNFNHVADGIRKL